MLNDSSSFCCFSLNLKVPAETGSWINSDWCFITGAGLQNRGIRILVCDCSGENERKQQIAAAVCHSWISLADWPIIHRNVIPSHARSGASPRRIATLQRQAAAPGCSARLQRQAAAAAVWTADESWHTSPLSTWRRLPQRDLERSLNAHSFLLLQPLKTDI